MTRRLTFVVIPEPDAFKVEKVLVKYSQKGLSNDNPS